MLIDAYRRVSGWVGLSPPIGVYLSIVAYRRLSAPNNAYRRLSAPLGASRRLSAPIGAYRRLSTPIGAHRRISAPIELKRGLAQIGPRQQ